MENNSELDKVFKFMADKAKKAGIDKKENYHVYPLGDKFPHNTEYMDCLCNPRILKDKKGAVIVHNSYDGREIKERAIKV